MKRAGFTMIELIFVIVILGILSAVALPKFIGVSEQAEAGKCKAFVGTLNRTVGPALWSEGVLNSLTFTTAADKTRMETDLLAQIEIPTACAKAGSSTQAAMATDYIAAITGGADFEVTVGNKTFDVNGTDATNNSAPIWGWTKQP